MLLCAVTLNWRNLPEEIKIHPRVYVFIRAFQRFSNSSQTIFFSKNFILLWFASSPPSNCFISFCKGSSYPANIFAGIVVQKF